MGRLAGIATVLRRTVAQTPSLFVVPAADYGDVQRELQRICGCRNGTVNVDENTPAFTEHMGIYPTVVIKRPEWEKFQNGNPNATATVAHEMGHVEERLRFGHYPDRAQYGDAWVSRWLFRSVWSEFFAERVASSYYDRNRWPSLNAHLRDQIIQHSASGVAFDLGRMLGFADGKGMNLQQVFQTHGQYGTSYETVSRGLMTLFTNALANNARPDLEQIGNSLEQLDPLLQ